MNFLIFTTKFFHSDGSYWLTSELVKKLLDDEHCVTVLNFYWSDYEQENSELTNNANLKIINCFPLKGFWISSFFIKWFFSCFKFLSTVLFLFVKRKKFDRFVCFSPALPFWALIPFGNLMSKKSILVYWDFFPVHNFSIKKRWFNFLEFVLKKIEKLLVLSFDKVGLMSEYNIRYFKKYFSDSQSQELTILPIWSSRIVPIVSEPNVFKQFFGLDDSIVIIFGGQLTYGRGVIELIKAVINANRRNPLIKLLILGDGPLYDSIYCYAKKFPSVILLNKSLPREQYINLLKYVDIGFVSTDSSVDTPSYPSKSLDYMMCGLPIIAAVEQSTDFGFIIESNNIGLACNSNDINNMSALILKLAEDTLLRASMSEHAMHFFQTHHHIDSVIDNFYK